MSFDDLLNATLVIKRLAPTATGTDTVGGASTTLSAAAIAGAIVIAVASATSMTANDYLRIGASGATEVARIASLVGTSVTLTAALTLDHASGDAVREVTAAGTAVIDDYGQPVMAPATVATVDGRIRPVTAREVPLVTEAGAVLSTHVGDLWPLAGLDSGCWIESGGIRYDITGISDAAGAGHHLMLGLKAIG